MKLGDAKQYWSGALIKYVTIAAMASSWLYFSLLLLPAWAGRLLGFEYNIWELFDLPKVASDPPLFVLLIGFGVSAGMLASLTVAYLSVWRILDAGSKQDFRMMGNRMRCLAYGLLGFWIGWNVLTGGVLALLIYVHPQTGIPFEYSFFDLDIIFPIVAISIIAVSQTMERAWAAENETSHFL